MKALIGEPVMHVYVDLDGGPGRRAPGFARRGRLVRPGKQTPDGSFLPAHTRVSAVMVIEVFENEKAEVLPLPENESLERKLRIWANRKFSDDNAFWPEHRALVVHNPFAEVPLSAETFASFPQLVKVREGEMEWTDREDG